MLKISQEYDPFDPKEESIADLGYIKIYARKLIENDPKISPGTANEFLMQIIDLADKVYRRHFVDPQANETLPRNDEQTGELL